MDIVIRPMASQELPRLIKLQREALLSSGKPDYTDRQLEAIINSQHKIRDGFGEIIVVAEQQGQIVGFAALVVGGTQIAGVYVRPTHMRQGIGCQLVQHLEKISVESQNSYLTVVSALNATSFYQALGYQVLGKTAFWARVLPWPIKVPCTVLRKQLTENSIKVPTHHRRNRKQWIYLLFLVAIALILALI